MEVLVKIKTWILFWVVKMYVTFFGLYYSHRNVKVTDVFKVDVALEYLLGNIPLILWRTVWLSVHFIEKSFNFICKICVIVCMFM